MIADRRTVLGGLASLPLAACVTAADVTGEGSLASLASRSGRQFGSAIAARGGGSIRNPAYAALVRSQCNLVVPENEMKWQALRPDADTYDFNGMDAIVRWAAQHGLAVRGHTLLWHRPEWFPQWLNAHDFGANPRLEAERLLTGHIRAVVERYGPRITSWDVVNEAIDHQARGPVQTSLSRAMGGAEAVLDLAFHAARDLAPASELVYNDYMSWEPQHAAHCSDVLRLLEGFRKRGTPVDTLGIQSHIEVLEVDRATGVGPYRERAWRDFLNEVTGMGYRLLITEFDVKDNALPAEAAARDAKVAEYARRYFDVMLDQKALGDVLAWGLADRFSWLQDFAPRSDGLAQRCCPYDDRYRAKPLRNVIAAALTTAQAR